MKKRILMSILMLSLTVALIGGATMAWFTDSSEVANAEFTAGTVAVKADSAPVIGTMPGKYFDNVNPGDCARVTWNILNTGTKAAELRVKLDKAWTSELSADNVYFAPIPGTGWEMYDDEGTIWLYYTAGPVDGIYNPEGEPNDPVVIPLTLAIAFDGAATGNEYQAQRFTLSGIVEAIQASNNAPATVWGNGWTSVKAEDYAPAGLAAQYISYFVENEVPCYPTPEPEPAAFQLTTIAAGENGIVTGAGTYEAGTEVNITATANPGFTFVNWTRGEEVVSTSPNFTFTMPEGDVTLVANFRPACIASFELNINKPEKVGSNTKVTGTITQLKYDNGAFVSGPQTVRITVTKGTTTRYTDITLNFVNGNASFSNVLVNGVATDTKSHVKVTIGGVTRQG